MEIWEENVDELNKNLTNVHEHEAVEYTGIIICQNCKQFVITQTYIDRHTNRQRRVCSNCFLLAFYQNIILKEVINENIT